MENQENGAMVFEDLAPVEIPVKIGGVDYVLREADEDAHNRYRNKIMSATKFDKRGKPVGIEGIADADTVLLSRCLFEKYTHEGQVKERPVIINTILRWKSRITQPLIKRLKQISDLKDVPVDEDETVESLEAQLVETQQKLDALRNGDAALKNL